MNQHEPVLPTIKAPEGYRPVFHDMNGMTASEYRDHQRKTAPKGERTNAQVIATYRELKSWAATAALHNLTTYHVKKIVRGQ